MIVGRRFTWGHIPKTGGDATYALAQHAMDRHSGLNLQMSAASNVVKHSPFGTHLDPGGRRIYVLNIRRLPAWTLSVMMHRLKFGWLAPDVQPHQVSVQDAIDGRWADGWLAWMLNQHEITIDGAVRYLRMESLALDFARFLDQVEAPRRRTTLVDLDPLKPVNAMEYDHDVAHWFSPAEIHRLYLQNPVWAEIEAKVYEQEGVPA